MNRLFNKREFLRLFSSAAVAIPTAFATARVMPSEKASGKSEKQETVFDRVMRTKTLRCGYVDYQPAVMKDLNTGKLYGFAYDIVNRLGENLGFKVDWTEEVNPATMIEGLITDRYDMVSTPFWPNADRIKAADFTIGFYYSGMGIWVRSNDHRFDKDIKSINDTSVTLSVMDGTMLVEYAQQNFPKAKTFSVPQGSPLTDLLLNVTNGKADVVVLDNYLAKDFEAANKGSIRQALDGANVRTYPNAFIIKQGETRMKSVIDVALEELMNSGYTDEMISKYEKYPGTFLRMSKPYKEY